MNRTKTLYQTLEDRSNPVEIKNHGPYKCDRKNAWLGPGYYFWDTNIELAHWWGRLNYVDYIIGKIDYFFDTSKIYDLLEPENLKDFREYANMLINSTDKKYTVSAVLKHMKLYSNFKYKGVRMRGEHCTKDIKNNKLSLSVRHYLDLIPPVQVCLFYEDDVKLYPFEIVHPAQYLVYNITDMSGMTI